MRSGGILCGERAVDALDFGRTEPCRRPLKHDPAAGETDDVLGIPLRELELVQAHDGRDAVRLADRVQQPKNAIRRCRIETRNGLVGKQKRWLLNEGTCDADTLLLATGQLIGATQGILHQPGTLDRVERKTFLRHWQREQGAQSGMITQASRQHVAQHRRTAN